MVDHVISLLFTSAEDAAISLNKATGVMRANVDNWEQIEKIKLQKKLDKAKEDKAKSVSELPTEKAA